MRSRIVIDAHLEERIRPKNLIEKDFKLFEHEFSLSLPSVTLVELDHVSIFRNVIFSIQKLKFYKSLTHIFLTPKKYFFKRLLLVFTVPKHLENGIWITDEISAEYFHWFTDALSRLKAIESSHEDINILKQKFPIILPDSYKAKQYISHSLDLLGYTPFYYNTKKRLKVSSLISCSHTAPTGNYNTELIHRINQSLALQNTHAPTRKIYISRIKATKRKVLNEKAVIQLLLQFNYEIYIFEDYSFAKQLEIMSGTKTMVSIHGAGLTNMLFMKKGGQILEIRNEGDSHNNCYFSLSSSLDHDYYYLNSKGDREDTNSVNITVDLSEFKNLLEQIN